MGILDDKIIAFIPVRGGSKSIPLKNIKLFCGKPLLYWTIKAACECKLIDRVYVSTDNSEIWTIVQSFNFENLCLVSRGEQTATDNASTELAMLEFAKEKNFDKIVLIQATNPLLESEDIYNGIMKFEVGGYDSLLSVVRQKRFIWEEVGKIAYPKNYELEKRPRRQDMQGYFVENGAFYITKREDLLNHKLRLSGNIALYEMKEDTYFEIDEPSDWIVVERLKFNRIKSSSKKGKKINLLICDVDGVLTDGGMYYDAKDNELKKFNTKDGKGFELLHNSGIKIMLLTSEDISIVKRRAEKLNVDYLFMGIQNKNEFLEKFYSLHPEHSYQKTAYIGDDVNDGLAMQKIALSAAPNDAIEEIKSIVDYVCKNKGGDGCVREFCEFIIRWGE